MELSILNKDKKVKVSDKVFAREFSEALVHQVVTSYLAGSRAGTKAQKNRSAVRGGGAKPWRQKGTGRARAGTIRSPLWKGGGKTFAASPRDFSNKVNKKMYRGALASILSELLRQERLIIVDKIDLKEAKTKLFVKQLEKFGIQSGIIVVDELDKNLHLASRNVPNINVITPEVCDPATLVSADKVVLTTSAATKLQEQILC